MKVSRRLLRRLLRRPMQHYYLFRYSDEPIGTYWLTGWLTIRSGSYGIAEVHRMRFLEEPHEMGVYTLEDIDPVLKMNCKEDTLKGKTRQDIIRLTVDESELSGVFFRQVKHMMR